jgi:hypothetical protein
MDEILRDSAWVWRTNPHISKLLHGFHSVVDLYGSDREESTKHIMITFLFRVVCHPNSTCLVEPFLKCCLISKGHIRWFRNSTLFRFLFCCFVPTLHSSNAAATDVASHHIFCVIRCFISLEKSCEEKYSDFHYVHANGYREISIIAE